MKKLQRGFSLIEMMIAMLIGIFLLAGVTIVMINSKKTYNSQADRVLLQENARFAFEYMAKDIRMHGYFGCSGKKPVPQAPDLANHYEMRATNDEGVISNHSDSLHVAYADPARNAFVISYNTGNTPFTQGKSTFQPTDIVNFGALATGDDVVLFDCAEVELHKNVTVSATNQLILGEGLTREFSNQDNSSSTEMRRLIDYTYGIRGVDEDGEITTTIPPYSYALFRNAELVVEGVENMQLRFGIDTGVIDGVPNQYVTMDNVGTNPVVSVKITLLMATIDERRELEPDTNTYILDANDYPATAPYNPTDDKRRRSVFSMIVKLRN